MRHSGWRPQSVWLLLLLSLWISASGAWAQAPTTSKAVRLQKKAEFQTQARVALVVGVASYPPTSDFSPLKYSASDAQRVAEELRKRGYSVRLLVNEEAGTQAVREALDDLRGAWPGLPANRDRNTMHRPIRGREPALNPKYRPRRADSPPVWASASPREGNLASNDRLSLVAGDLNEKGHCVPVPVHGSEDEVGVLGELGGQRAAALFEDDGDGAFGMSLGDFAGPLVDGLGGVGEPAGLRLGGRGFGQGPGVLAVGPIEGDDSGVGGFGERGWIHGKPP